MSADHERRVGTSAARASKALAIGGILAGVAACSGESGNALSPGAINARVSTIAIEPVGTPVLAGDTVQLVAIARDDEGRVVERASVSWSVSDESRARLLPGGRLVGVGHGPVTVSATAGRATAAASVTTRLTTEERRFAYAWIHDPGANAEYAPTSSYQHNETGGAIRVARRAVGQYVVSFERMAKVDSAFRETVIVTPHGAAGERCHLGGWGNNANGRDLDVAVSCFTFAGASVDARFAVLVVGSRSLPSRLGFTAAGSAESSFAADPAHTFASFAERVAIARSTAGSYLVQWNAAGDNTPQNYFVSTWGGAADLCKVSSWNRGVWASVICYNPSGALADARFSLLMVEHGRPGKRFGFAWANEPASPLGTAYTPSLEYQRTSSGARVTVTRRATGQYQVSFPGLAKTGTRPETVHVSPYGGGLFACQVQGWGNSADDSALDATVRCWNRGNGMPADTYFTILVLE